MGILNGALDDVGTSEGLLAGSFDRNWEGDADGSFVGTIVSVGTRDGASDGVEDGAIVFVGASDTVVGFSDGVNDGDAAVGVPIFGFDGDELGKLEVSIGCRLAVGFEVTLEDLEFVVGWALLLGFEVTFEDLELVVGCALAVGIEVTFEDLELVDGCALAVGIEVGFEDLESVLGWVLVIGVEIAVKTSEFVDGLTIAAEVGEVLDCIDLSGSSIGRTSLASRTCGSKSTFTTTTKNGKAFRIIILVFRLVISRCINEVIS